MQLDADPQGEDGIKKNVANQRYITSHPQKGIVAIDEGKTMAIVHQELLITVQHKYPFARANNGSGIFRNDHVKGKAQCEEDILQLE